jgi:O-antigen ligase
MKFLSYDFVFEKSLVLVAISMILIPKFVPLFCILFLVSQIIGISKKEVTYSINWVLILLALFYLAYLIGVIFSDNMPEAKRYLENKLSFLILPLLFIVQPKSGIKIKSPIIGLIISVLLLSFYNFINSILSYSETNSIDSFLSSSFSTIHHPTYYSVFVIISFVCFYKGCKENWKYFNKISFSIYSLLCFVCIFLSSSLSIFLFLIICMFIYAIYFLYKRISLFKFSIILLFVPLLFLLIVKYTPNLSSQFASSQQYVLEFIEDPEDFIRKDRYAEGGNVTRLIMWKVSFDEIIKHPFGVGTGNVDFYLSKRLENYNRGDLAVKLYNPHNQFLQTTLEIGIFGLLIFMLLLFQAFRLSFLRKDYILLFIVFTLSFNSLFESMLQRQSGIVFFSFWICLLVSYNSFNSKNDKYLKYI